MYAELREQIPLGISLCTRQSQQLILKSVNQKSVRYQPIWALSGHDRGNVRAKFYARIV